METLLLKGKPIAERNQQLCLDEVEKKGFQPKLGIFMVGNDPASEYYVASIQKQAQKFNCQTTVQKYSDIEATQLIQHFNTMQTQPDIQGIIIQKPLPKHINPSAFDNIITPEKDLDGINPINTGLLLQEKECFIPCTAQAILEIMDYYNISAEKKHVVVVGRSNVVGKPIANLLLYKQKNRNATVTVCHSQTPNLKHFTTQADILIVAVGVPKLIKADMISDNAIIIDAGINEVVDNNGKSSYVGDVDFDDCTSKCSAITPVPGGVGSVTTSILFKHLCKV